MHKARNLFINSRPDALIVNAVSSVLIICSASVTFAQQAAVPLPEAVMTRGAAASEAFPPAQSRSAVRALNRSVEWQPGDPIKEVPRQLTHPAPTGDRTPANPRATTRDALMETQARASRQRTAEVLSQPQLNFDGHPFTGVNPPDTVGDVGRRFYIQMLNGSDGSRFIVHDKATGDVVVPATDLDTLGTGICANGAGDPIVLYDQLANRWLMSEFAPRGDNTLCVYVSITDDPTTGGWFAYSFQATDFPDYPKYAVWPDAYYLASNESSPTVYAFDRQSMLNGQPATFQKFTAPSLDGFRFQALQPADLGGSVAPPTGAPNYFVRHRDDEAHDPSNNDPSSDFLEIFEFHVDFADAANSTFTGPFVVPMSEFDSELCGFSSFSCFEQPSGRDPLDPLREVVMWRVVYRNFGEFEALVGNLVTDVNGNDQGGIRWFELRKTPQDNIWRLFQEGTYAPDQQNRWMGSIAMDGVGNIAVGYSVGSGNLSAGLRYTGRQRNDPGGTFAQPERVLVDGQGSITSIRWGDYSSLNVDPDDDCTFWFTSTYALNDRWQTRIGNFSFSGCGD